MRISWDTYDSPLGPLTLLGHRDGLTALRFPDEGEPLEEAERRPALFAQARAQLDEYFAGRRRRFDLALELTGTPFQRRVWAALVDIPYGTTRSYTELGRAIDRPDRVRAVGAAVGRTPIPIFVPCHRVVGAGGALTGYRGGLQRKRALLDVEARSPGIQAAGRQLQLT